LARYGGYFQKLSHGKGTGGDHKKLLLPKVRTETARKQFVFQRAIQYNKQSNERNINVINSY
jgi:hypothetical protein